MNDKIKCMNIECEKEAKGLPIHRTIRGFDIILNFCTDCKSEYNTPKMREKKKVVK